MASFYAIRSKQAESAQGGLYKQSLACAEDGSVFLFCWLDGAGLLKHLQLVYDEQALDWRPGEGFSHSWTNRRVEGAQGIGFAKGSRSLQQAEDPQGRQKGLDLLKEAQLPEPFAKLVAPLFD